MATRRPAQASAPPVHPVALVRRRLSDGGLQRLLLEPLQSFAPDLLRHSRRGGRLAERLAGDRPALTLSSALAEISGQMAGLTGRPGAGLPRILVDKFAWALHRMLDDRGAPTIAFPQDFVAGTVPEDTEMALRPLEKAVRDLIFRLERHGPDDSELVSLRRRRTRVSIDDGPPPGFFYTEDPGPVPTGMLLPIDVDDGPLAFVGVRGPLLSPTSQHYAAERILDVVSEPIFDEAARLKRLAGGRFGALLAALDELVIVDADVPRLAWIVHRDGLLTPVARGATEALKLPPPARRTPRHIDDLVRTLPYATDQDRAVAAALVAHGRVDGQAARALLDHPFVEGEDGRPLRVVEAAPRVDVDDTGTVTISARGQRLDLEALGETGAVLSIDHQRSQAVVVVADARERSLAKAVALLGGKPLPDQKLAEVVTRLKRGRLEVALPERLRGRRTDADPRLLVKVALQAAPTARKRTAKTSDAVDTTNPKAGDGEGNLNVAPETSLDASLEALAGAGARFSVVARPLPGGASYLPGEGAAIVFADAGDGHSQWCERNLEGERATAGRLLAAANVGEEDVDGAFAFTILSGARALAAVATLARRPDVQLAFASAEFETQRAGVGSLRVQLAQRTDWLGIDGGIHIDGVTRASLSAIMAALRAGRRYVVVDNSLISLEDDLVEALTRLLPLTRERKGALEVPRHGAVVLDDALGDLARENASAVVGWHLVHDALSAARAVDDVPPPSLTATLRPYQREGLRFLRRLVALGAGGILADDMGLGKTLTTIALMVERGLAGPQLVVAPTSLGFHWAQEIARFAPSLRAITVMDAGPDERRERIAKAGPNDVVVISYGVAARDVDALRARTWSSLICDEAQAVKNANTVRAQALRTLRASFRLILTGTPVENHTGEFWALLDLASPGLFGTFTQWKARFADPIDRDDDHERRRRLALALRPFVLRRRKVDVAKDLPEKTEVVQVLTPTPEERERYEHLRLALIADLDEHGAFSKKRKRDDAAALDPGQRRVQILSALTRLRLCACHPGFVDDVLDLAQAPAATKQRTLVHLLEEVREAGHQALVFSQFVRHLRFAERHLQAAGLKTLCLTGETPAMERQNLVERFQAGEADVFCISLKAGGFGLNLTRASTVVHLDPWWNPAVEDQASDRAHRIGQTLPVTVVRLVMEGTIEGQILDLHVRKRDLADALLDGADAAGRLSVDDLEDLIRSNRRHIDDDGQQRSLRFPTH